MRRKPKAPPAGMFTATIEKLSHDGRGLARIDGKTTFIHGALPNEVVEFKYTKTAKGFDEGQAENIINASPDRATPKCDHYKLCGGCSLQHLDESIQIKEKEAILLDMFQRLGHVEPENILPPLRANSWNYRNKARISVRYIHRLKKSLLGFRQRNNAQFITDISQCPILHEQVEAQIPQLQSLINDMSNLHSIAQVEVAAGDDKVALILRHLEPLTDDDFGLWRAFSDKTGFVIYLQPKGPDSVTRLHPPADNDYLEYRLEQENIRFLFHPNDFTQVNAPLNQKMVALAMELMDVQANDVVLDLFCGLGNFSLPLAKRAKKVIGVEGSEAMVARAQMNAKLNHLNNVAFYAQDLDKVDALATLINEPCNKLLIDPPRSGALEIVKQIEHLNPERIVYVSCNPATLARDAEILVHQKNYRLVAAGVMDMFVHTTHVESIALFEKG